MDTGCVDMWWGEYEYSHEDLVNWIDYGLSWDMVDGDWSPFDTCGHGTMVAGIIGADTDNWLGIASLSWDECRLGIIKITEDHAVDYDDAKLAVGTVWAALNGADVINFSLGQYDYSEVVHKAVEGAYDLGVVMVGARGNQGITDVFYPACHDEVIAVTGLTFWNNLAPMSNYGWGTECTAPGYKIWSTTHSVCEHFVPWNPGDPYNWTTTPNPDEGGTSFAAAHVSAITGIIAAACPWAYDPPAGLIEQWVRPILHESCVDIGPLGMDEYYGYGRVNLKDACDLAFWAGDGGRIARDNRAPVPGSDVTDSEAEKVADETSALIGCYPNPAAGPVYLSGALAGDNTWPVVTVEIYDLSGRRVSALTAPNDGGRYALSWDLTTTAGRRVPPGVYVVLMAAGKERAAVKVAVTR